MDSDAKAAEVASSFQQSAQPSSASTGAWTSTPTTSAPIAGATGKSSSIGGAIVLICLAAIGVISPWLSYIEFDSESANGWRTKSELLDYADKFSAGPVLILITGLLALACGIAILSGQKKGSPLNRKALGITCLISGLVMAGAGGATYTAIDELAKEEGVFVNTGIGLSLGILMGLGVLIMGIVILAKPSVTEGG